MIGEYVRRWAARLVLVVGGAAVIVGCPERADEITEPASSASINFPVASAYVEPEGPFAIDRVRLAQIDTSVADALSRTGTFETDAISFVTGCPTDDATCPGREFVARNGNVDLRPPALVDPDAAAGVGFIDQEQFGVILFVGSFGGLEPNSDYTVAMERLAININEGLDASNVLLDEPELQSVPPFLDITNPDTPDELVPLGGSPGNALGSNPFTFAAFTTDGSGGAFIVPAYPGADDQFDTNFLESFDLPQYNYLTVYDASGEPVLRAQIGVDLLPSGEPVNNAFGPFPTGALTTGEMLAANGGAGQPDSISVTFNNLEALTGGAEYTAWLVNPVSGEIAPAIATYNLIEIVAERDEITGEVISTTDELAETVSGTNQFVGGNQADGFRHQLVLSDATLATSEVGFFTHLMLTVDENPGDESSGSVTPLWFQFTDQSGTPENFFDDSFIFDGSTNFGNFDPADPSNSRLYNGSGVGQGGFRANILSVDLQNLTRPPVGYEIVAWLLPEEGDPVRLPDITGPPPARIDLTDADVDASSDLVTSTGILRANFRAEESDVGDFQNFLELQVTLEPKAGTAGMGPIPVYLGTVPELLRNRE